ncbi:alpha/beta hydrolase [Gordonia sp. CPCC 205515]|uniref:alpha/beta fold hydrolase n=1 Tax=Gordonia sp. CPCC 205515 TaxID=3140791 RepID=UPI003AF3BD6F
MVLGGGQDHLIPRADIVDLADRIPEAALSVFDDCGHLINFEQPQRFDTEVAEFLGTGW